MLARGDETPGLPQGGVGPGDAGRHVLPHRHHRHSRTGRAGADRLPRRGPRDRQHRHHQRRADHVRPPGQPVPAAQA